MGRDLTVELDIRAGVARAYDLNPLAPEDVPFYLARLPRPDASVLELGVGTGRVAVHVAAHSGYFYGIDASPAMLEMCQAKLAAAGLGPPDCVVERADVTDFDLGRRFDYVIAPYRVMQNLASDAEVEGMMRCIDRHLEDGGRCILNAFRPHREREAMVREWVSDEEVRRWEADADGQRVVCFDARRRLEEDPLVLYPELIYRWYRTQGPEEGEDAGEEGAGHADPEDGEDTAEEGAGRPDPELAEPIEEAVLKIAMRCWYPDELEELVTRHGFEVTGRWGGYEEEAWGEGGELVIEFRRA